MVPELQRNTGGSNIMNRNELGAAAFYLLTLVALVAIFGMLSQ